MIQEKPEREWDFVEPVDGVFRKYTAVETTEEVQKLVLNGNRIPEAYVYASQEDRVCELRDDSTQVRLYDFTGKFIGIYTYLEDSKEYKPVKLFMD